MYPSIEIQQVADSLSITAHFTPDAGRVTVSAYEPGVWRATTESGAVQRIIIRAPKTTDMDCDLRVKLQTVLTEIASPDQVRFILDELDKVADQAKQFCASLRAA